MKPMLLSGFGISINVDKRKLIIQNKIKNERIEFYPHKIDYDSIIIDGYTGNITFEAMRWIAKHNINLTLLNWNGNILSTTLSEQPKSGKLRINQYQKYLDSESRLDIASELIKQKIEKSTSLLEELSQFYSFVDTTQIKKLAQTEKPVYFEKRFRHEDFKTANLLRQFMAYEGRVSEKYTQNLSKIFAKLAPEFRFEGRKDKKNSRNYNASDEINALLNYGYAILESETRKAIYVIGLDYSIGFLHEINQSRTPLVYDIQELFRWIIDLSVIQLLEERNGLTKSDFIVTENYHIRLRESAAKALIEKIQLNFNCKVPYKNNKNYSYQNILHDNVQRLANYIVGKKTKLEFNIPRLEINRTDNLQIKEHILKMTPQQRKQLGLNKSTLWYLKQNLKTGRKTRIYNKVLTKIQSDI